MCLPIFAMAQKDTIITLPTQDGKVFYEHIYKDSGMTKNDLFIKAKDVFLRLFPDTKGVIQNEDKENGIITGKGNFSFTIKGGAFNLSFPQSVKCTFRIMVKDQKYKVVIFDFYSVSSNLQDYPIEDGYYTVKKKKKKVWYRYYTAFNDRVLEMFDQIENRMNKKLSTDF